MAATGPAARPRGFAVVELLAVIGVTVVIGAVAISAYRTYAVRSTDRGGRHGCGGDPAAHRDERSGATVRPGPEADRPRDRASPKPPRSSSSPCEIFDGRIELRFGRSADAAIAGSVLSLTPFETAEQDVVWVCGNGRRASGYNPSASSAASRQATQVLTTIDTRYLPAECR